MKRIIQWSLLLLCIVSIFGCGMMRNNILIPEQLPREDKIAEDLEKKYLSYDVYETKCYNDKTKTFETKWEKSKVAQYMEEFNLALQGTGTASIAIPNVQDKFKYQRNDIIGNLILLMNIRYAQYERAFYNTGASVGSAFDITTLVVTATGAVAGGAQTKSILSAIASGLTGSRLALEKNFLYEKASPVIIAKMRKLREDKLKIITANMKEPIDKYSLEQGLLDVQDYFYKGTVIGALQAMSEEIGKPTPIDLKALIKSIKETYELIQPTTSPTPEPSPTK